MKHIISFCIYGDNSEKKQKYRRGLLENIDTINTLLPVFNIFIAAGSDVDDDYLDQIKSTYKNIIIKNHNGENISIIKDWLCYYSSGYDMYILKKT